MLWDVNPGISLCFLVLDLPGYSLGVLWLCLTFVTDLSLLFFSFQGLHLLHQASLLCVEAQCLEAVGLQKVKLAVAGCEVEGLYRLVLGVLSHSAMPMAPPLIKKC